MASLDFQPRLPWDPPGTSSIGRAEAAYRSHDTPPYHESAAKAALRYILAGLQGAAAARPGQGFLGNAGLGAMATYKLATDRRNAAEEYAAQQVKQQQDAEDRDMNRKYKEAIIESLKKPPAPEKPLPKSALQQAESDLGRPLNENEKKVLLGLAPRPVSVKPGGPDGTKAAKPPNSAQLKESGFYSVANSAEQNVRREEDAFGKMSLKDQFWLSKAPNVALSPAQQKYRQAQNQWIETVLRETSGAAIATSEYDAYRHIYFSQPGDSKEVRDQKRAARQVQLNKLRTSAGAAARAGAVGKADVIWNPQTQELEPAR